MSYDQLHFSVTLSYMSCFKATKGMMSGTFSQDSFEIYLRHGENLTNSEENRLYPGGTPRNSW